MVFGGTVTAAKGEVAWQWGVDSGRLLDQDWAQVAPILDALTHPVRLRLLQQVLNGVITTADLAEDPSLGTTGQLHHQRALVAAGWLQSTGRGQLAVARAEAQSGWLKHVSLGASRGSSAGGVTGVAGRLAAAAFSRSRRETGCGTQGRSPRLSFAPTTLMPSASSHSATAP